MTESITRIAVIGSGTASRELPEHLQTLGGAQVAARIVNPRLSVFAFTPYDELLVDVGYVDAAVSAATAGCDAIMINSFADYGLEAASAAVNVPVIGAGAATLAAAAAGGRRFAIVTVWPRSMNFINEERLRATGLTQSCIGVWHVSPEQELLKLANSDGVMQRMAQRENSIISSLAQACDAAQSAGAEAIVLGCTCMAPISETLQASVALPLFEASRCGLLAAIAAARTSVPTQSLPRARQTQRITALVDCWSGAAENAATTAESPCPVCID